MNMKYYFAHPISIYNTKKEAIIVDMIMKCPFFSNPQIINPNQKIHQVRYIKEGMDYFLKLVDECDSLVIYPFEDKTIGAGIVKEALRALDNGKRIYQIDPTTFDIEEIFKLKNCLTVEETREKLKKINNINL